MSASIAQLKIAFDNAESIHPGFSRFLIVTMIETLQQQKKPS